jgi:tRNA U34 5-carboxymethylaminomethyl modifying enzyme MnmG/GidA
MPPHSKILGMRRAEELGILFQEFISENSDKIDQIKQEIKIMKNTEYELDEQERVEESIENLENEITKKNMRIDFMKKMQLELPDVSNSIKILRSISVSMKLEKRIHFANRDNNSPVWANYEMHEQEIVDEKLLKLSKDSIEKIKGDDKQIRKMINLCI